MKNISSSRREIELLDIIINARSSLERRQDIDSKNSSPALLEFMSKIISYLQSSVSYVSKGSEVSRKLKEETGIEKTIDDLKHVFTFEYPLENVCIWVYFKDDNDITSPHLIWSCTKQVMGLLTGIALENGTLASLDADLSEYTGEPSSYWLLK